MNSQKVGKFIQEIRKKNNLTQKQLADKYNVTYQAVSKWERGINLPDVTLLRQMSKDFNISIEDILDGSTSKQKRNNIIPIIIIILVIIASVIGIIYVKNDKSFEFKTISTTCKEFKVSGSIAYDKEKSSIYISHVDYCGGNDETTYKNIECNLYESNDDLNKKISSCKPSDNNTTLEEYLKDVEINIDNYSQTCKQYNNKSLYLEINATDKNDKTVVYKIPLELNDNCSK